MTCCHTTKNVKCPENGTLTLHHFLSLTSLSGSSFQSIATIICISPDFFFFAAAAYVIYCCKGWKVEKTSHEAQDSLLSGKVTVPSPHGFPYTEVNQAGLCILTDEEMSAGKKFKKRLIFYFILRLGLIRD